jgi:small-conductance mechanosensitive channel
MSLSDEWPTIASKVLVEISRLLAESKIEIPFPQRDLHIRSMAPEVSKAFAE